MGSAAIHVIAVVLVWVSQVVQPREQEFLVYEIDLVSPPPARVVEEEPEPAATEELVVETPRDPEPEPEAPPPPEAEEEPREVETPPPETAEAEPEPEPEEETRPASTAEPDPEAGTESGEDINVRMEGLRRDYPVYYENIITQMRRCFRWRGRGGLEATVQFDIRRDGSVEDIHVVRESGSPTFDIEAMGAAECAGAGRLGPLPEDLGLDRLPIRFTFRPLGGE